jgi:hypothetical protein
VAGGWWLVAGGWWLVAGGWGAVELAAMSGAGGNNQHALLCRYLTAPEGFQGRVLNKYGLKTEAAGTIKVRCCLTSRWLAARACSRAGPVQEGPCCYGVPQVRVHSLTQHAQPAPALRAASPERRAAVLRSQKRDASLAVVVERARARLKEARGGEVRSWAAQLTSPAVANWALVTHAIM